MTWNSEAGQVGGTIIKVHTKDVEYKGYTHDASKDEPQHEIKSDKTDHIAMHKGVALRRSGSPPRKQASTSLTIAEPASTSSLSQASAPR